MPNEKDRHQDQKHRNQDVEGQGQQNRPGQDDRNRSKQGGQGGERRPGQDAGQNKGKRP